MTFCFIQAIQRWHSATYGNILTAMRNALRSAGSSGSAISIPSLGGGGGAVVSSLLSGGSASTGGLKQEPQLTACEPFDVYAKPFFRPRVSISRLFRFSCVFIYFFMWGILRIVYIFECGS